MSANANANRNAVDAWDFPGNADKDANAFNGGLERILTAAIEGPLFPTKELMTCSFTREIRRLSQMPFENQRNRKES